MSASQINDLINPARLRLGIKRAFTGDINEILSELFGDFLGHSDIRMTQRYAHAKEKGVHQAVARLAERAKKIVPNLSQEKKSRSSDLP
jgi:integrase